MKLNDKEAESKARSEAALQALHDENKRLGLYDYEIGFIDGKASAKREWVGLTDEEGAEIWGDAHDIDWNRLVTPKEIIKRIEAKLKEKNT